jgi:hypothetical protein
VCHFSAVTASAFLAKTIKQKGWKRKKFYPINFCHCLIPLSFYYNFSRFPVTFSFLRFSF